MQQDFDLKKCRDAVEFLRGMYNFLEECGKLSVMVDKEKNEELRAAQDTMKTYPSLTAAAKKEAADRQAGEKERKTASRGLHSIKEQATEGVFESEGVREYLKMLHYEIVGVSSSVCVELLYLCGLD